MPAINKKPPEITKRAREMRRSPTPAENILWRILRNRQIEGCKFVRQHPISPYIVDFCCRDKKLVIEVDGGIHVGQEDYDRSWDSYLAELGYRVMRFRNDDVVKNINAVAAMIQEALLR